MPRSFMRCFVRASEAAAEIGNRRTEPVVGRLDIGIEKVLSLGVDGKESPTVTLCGRAVCGAEKVLSLGVDGT